MPINWIYVSPFFSFLHRVWWSNQNSREQHPPASLYLARTNLIRDSGLGLLLFLHLDEVTIRGCARALLRALLQILSARGLLYGGQHLVSAWDGSWPETVLAKKKKKNQISINKNVHEFHSIATVIAMLMMLRMMIDHCGEVQLSFDALP